MGHIVWEPSLLQSIVWQKALISFLKMAKLAGKWKLESTDNFDNFMKAVGVGMVMRKMGGAAKPSQEISINGDTWTIKTISTFKNTEITFQLGVEFDETTADGRKMKTTCTVEGDNKLIQDQKGEHPSILTRELTDDNTFKMTLLATEKNETCTRVYKRQ